MKNKFLHKATASLVALIVMAGSFVTLGVDRVAADTGDQSTKAGDVLSVTNMISVKDKGAVGDGKTDDTAAFSKALVESVRTGMPVYVPDGTYRVTKTLPISESLVGYNVKSWPDDIDKMPTLLIDHAGTGAIVTSGGISGVNIRYSDEAAKKVSDEGARKPAISMFNCGVVVRNVTITNAYSGLVEDDTRLSQGNGGRTTVDNVIIEHVFNTGVYFAGSYDYTKLHNIVVRSSRKAFAESGIGFLLGKNDQVRVQDCYVDGAHIGYQFVDEGPRFSDTTGGSVWGPCENISADNVDIGYYFHLTKYSTVVTFTEVSNSVVNARKNAVVFEGNYPQVSFYNVKMSAETDSVAYINGGEVVTFADCEFTGKAAVPAINLKAVSNLTINNSKISSKGDGVLIGSQARNVAVVGNTITASGNKVVNPAGDTAAKMVAGNK